MSAAGLSLNVTLIFSQRQYEAARAAVWKGAQRRPSLEKFKSVYSIFVSRIDVYTAKHVPQLSPAAQGWVGIVNAKRLWKDNQSFWKDKKLPLKQEIVFASTGTKNPGDPPDKYVSELAGSDIQTNPPATNAEIQKLAGKTFTRKVDQFPPKAVLSRAMVVSSKCQAGDIWIFMGPLIWPRRKARAVRCCWIHSISQSRLLQPRTRLGLRRQAISRKHSAMTLGSPAILM